MQPTLAALARRLEGDTFFQISRTAIVSLDAIREAKPFPDGTGEIMLANGLTLLVARRRWRALMEKLEQLTVQFVADAPLQNRSMPLPAAICSRAARAGGVRTRRGGRRRSIASSRRR